MLSSSGEQAFGGVCGPLVIQHHSSRQVKSIDSILQSVTAGWLSEMSFTSERKPGAPASIG